MHCTMCGTEISERARACPFCGAVPYRRSAPVSGVVLIVVGACIAGGIYYASKLFGSKPLPATPEEIQAACAADWTKCKDNAALMQVTSISQDIKAKCVESGDRQIQSATLTWPFNAFQGYHMGRDYIDSGIAEAVENNAQVETRSGRSVNTRVRCRYDLMTKTVLSVEFSKDFNN